MNKDKKNDILEYVLVILVVIIVRTFLVTPALVHGASMEPTLYDNEVLILNKFSHNIKDFKRFDIIVFKYNGENLIKRVIAFPNEKLEYKDNKLYINGEEIEFDFEFELVFDVFFVFGGSEPFVPKITSIPLWDGLLKFRMSRTTLPIRHCSETASGLIRLPSSMATVRYMTRNSITTTRLFKVCGALKR